MALERVIDILQTGCAEGLHLGAQLYVSHRGVIAADLAIGETRPGVPMRTDTILPWQSSGKPVAAIAIGQLWERGRLDLDAPVAHYLPEFGVNGKEAVTIRQVLTHTGGFRHASARWQSGAWDEILAAVCGARLEDGWVPGQRAGYHVATGWIVLGELVRRLDGRSFDRYAREEIFLPLGMSDSWSGLPAEQYRAYGERIGLMYDTTKQPPVPVALHSEAAAAVVRPGANNCGPARELGMFYESLQRGGAGVLRSETARLFTSRQRVGMRDETFGAVMDWGLGFIVNTPSATGLMPYGYGRHASAETYGHSGNQSSAGFCDPQLGLVVAWVCNGQCGERAHQERARKLNEAIYENVAQQGITSAV